jgi:hypothetical protein
MSGWDNFPELHKQGRGCGLDSSGSGQGLVAGCCNHGNELSSYIHKKREFLTSQATVSFLRTTPTICELVRSH